MGVRLDAAQEMGLTWEWERAYVGNGSKWERPKWEQA